MKDLQWGFTGIDLIKAILTMAISISAMVALMIWADTISPNGRLITECEKDLPRNQTCILMAVPEEVEK